MLIVTMKTDQPEAELALYDGTNLLETYHWLAHRELAESLHIQLKALLERQNKQLHDLQGVVVFKGPGSFTGLRIGISVANALAYGLGIPIVGTETDTWQSLGLNRLQLHHESDNIVSPAYGALPHITQQKK